jgi:excinuclease ABC subunit A
VAEGAPEDIAASEANHTGRFLREVLARRPIVRAGEGAGAKPSKKARARVVRQAAE